MGVVGDPLVEGVGVESDEGTDFDVGDLFVVDEPAYVAGGGAEPFGCGVDVDEGFGARRASHVVACLSLLWGGSAVPGLCSLFSQCGGCCFHRGEWFSLVGADASHVVWLLVARLFIGVGR